MSVNLDSGGGFHAKTLNLREFCGKIFDCDLT